uniref:Uncharacterized protein n=1 Tax=Siphoviridae sp. ctqw35 TaxID=2826471 RepID=A0A8S5LZW8_9CAUD|nr:MAG TPA: hypothetical protein [Siphoviridae sp. ctqw35]
MEEQLRIVVDKKGHTYIWLKGQRIKHTRKIKFEVGQNTGYIPKIEIEKDLLPETNLEEYFNKI